MSGAAVHVLSHDKDVRASGELEAVSALPSPPSLSQGHRDFTHGILKAAVNNPVVKLRSPYQLVSVVLAAAVS